MSIDQVHKFKKRLSQFKEIDFKVKLGSIIEEDVRDYYISRKFAFLEELLLNT